MREPPLPPSGHVPVDGVIDQLTFLAHFFGRRADHTQLLADTPVTLQWTPAADPTRSSIHVKLDISHHGGTKGMIECDTADAGSLELPGALVSELVDKA